MTRVLISVAIAALLAPAPSAAQISVGARLGVGVAAGDVGGRLPMGDWVNGQIPLQLDVLYRATPRFRVGGYLSWGYGLPGDVCDTLDCSASVTRVGVEATYSFIGGAFVPWIGAGIGYEWSTVGDGSLEGTFTGFELLNLQGGGDFQVTRRLSAGPYAAFSMGQYDEVKLAGMTGPIADKKMHEWLTLGIRGSFDLQ